MGDHRLSSGFASADAQGFAPPVPEDEVAAMLREDMTIEQASAYHLERWGLPPDFNLEHDTAHILMALSKTLPDAPSDYPYQADYEAEIYSVSAEMALFDAMQGKAPADDAQAKAKFLARVQENYGIYGPLGNLNRVVSWGLGRVAGIDGEQVRREVSFKDAAFYQSAEPHGIEVTQDQETWGVDIPGMDERFWYVDERRHYMPDDIEEVEDFTRFSRPSEAEAGAIYDRIKPGLDALTDFIESRIATYGDVPTHSMPLRQDLGSVKVRDLHAAMVAGFKPPAPGADADALEPRH